MEPEQKPEEPLELPMFFRVSPEEVARAVPPPSRPGFPQQAPPPPVAKGPRRSKLAICALVFGIAGLGMTCLVGSLAIVAGALALAAIHGNSELRGFKMAICGMVLGIISIAGWSYGLWKYLGEPWKQRPEGSPRILEAAGGPPPIEEIKGAPEPYRTGLLANVVVIGSAQGGEWTGSGIVIDREGDVVRVLTNRHVAEGPGGVIGAVTIWVLLSSGETAKAEVAWRAPGGIDLCVLELRPRQSAEVPVIPLRRGDMSIADDVYAIGNPLNYRWTFTKGVVSSVRNVDMGGEKVKVYQTQTPISSGNSGGGLYAADGRLVGINTWAADKAVSEGLGFSISVETLLEALGKSDHGWAARLVKAAER